MPSKRSRQASGQRLSSWAVPIVRIVELEAPTIPAAACPSLLKEINDRQWGAVSEVLAEAKFKAEAMLRNDAVYDSALRLAYYQGWVAYADYVIASLNGLRDEPASGSPEDAKAGPDD